MFPLLRSLCVLALVAIPALASERAFVRVNQLGYESGTEGRAYLMSPGLEHKASFRVVRSDGTQVFSGPIGATSGTWGAFTVYSLDFNVGVAGTYSITVDGTFPATSSSFRIATPKKLYSQALINALSFYQNERDGTDFIPSPLRSAPGHLLDQTANVYESPQFDSDDFILGDLKPTGDVIDASGGWWDAGDYLKFVQTHSYTIALMTIGIRDFPKQMGKSAGAADFTAEA